MTSSFTHNETLEYIQSKYKDLNIKCIKQKNMECYDEHKQRLKYYDGYAEAPNGNGDVFRAMADELPDCDYVNVISIDNALARVCDPLFLGFAFKNKLKVASKAIRKLKGESVGVFIKKGDKTLVTEYTEMKSLFKSNNELYDPQSSSEKESSSQHISTTEPRDVLAKKAGDFKYGNICNHIFEAEFFRKLKEAQLVPHEAFKKIPFTKNGKLINPTKPNGYKIEFFIFDAFAFTTKSGVLEVPREFEFAPIKNKEGPDSVETAVEALYNRSKIMLEMYGAKVRKGNVLLLSGESLYGEGLVQYAGKEFLEDEVIED